MTIGIDRRSLLLALTGGLAGAAASSLPKPLRAAPTAMPPRLVIVMQPNGTQQANFWPTAGFTSPILQPLLSDARLASKTIVVRGVQIPNDANGTDGNQHDIGFARLWTGHPLMNMGGHPWAGGPSIDQILASRFGTESLTTAVTASSVNPYPKPGFDNRRSFTYAAAGVHRTPYVDPLEAYLSMFPPVGALGEARRERLRLRQSILDGVAADLQSLRPRLSEAERTKVDVHTASIRTLEKRLSRQISGAPVSCSTIPPSPRDFRSTSPRLLVDDESAVPELISVMVDLIAATIGCGLTRVATLQLGLAGNSWNFGWCGINEDYHMNVAHKDRGDAGSSPENTAKVVRANQFFCAQVARLAKALDAIVEGQGTALDNTLIVWTNEMGRGDHSLDNIPVVMIGGAGGTIASGGRLVDRGVQPFQRLGCTVLNAFGVSAAGFGDLPTCGPLPGVLRGA